MKISGDGDDSQCFVFLKGIFECRLTHIRDIGRWRKSDDHPKKDLAKFDYRKHKYLIILPHFWLLGTKYRNVIPFSSFFFLFFFRLLLGFSDFWQLRPPKITSFFEFWIFPAPISSFKNLSKTCYLGGTSSMSWIFTRQLLQHQIKEVWRGLF